MLFKRKVPVGLQTMASLPEAMQADSPGKHQVAFACLYLVMVLMYVRPQEIMPEVFGYLPVVKIATIVTMLVYVASKLNAGERLISWSLEMKMVMVIGALGLIFLPFAASPQDSFNILFDPFIKTIIIFVMLVNLVDTRARLYSLLQILVVCEVLYAFSAIKTFLEGGYGESASFDHRIQGWGTMYGNPNDFASALNLMLPFAVIFALRRQGWARLFYFACAGISALGVFVTFSRSGFIGLVASGFLLLWKLSRGNRVRVIVATAIVAVALLVASPGKYMARLSTIFNPATDTTNSAQERQVLLKLAAELAVKRSIIGIGMGNFHIYSIHEKAAHNSFLETAAELGIGGFIAYLTLIFAPIRSLRRIERETRQSGTKSEREMEVLSICFQASFIAYIIYGFFGSVQYLNSLYFGVAYVVAFRQIHAAEQATVADPETPEFGAWAKLKRGTLWGTDSVPQHLLTGNEHQLHER